MTLKIKTIFEKNLRGKVTVKGWVKTVRAQKNHAFIAINDGSCIKHLQAVVTNSLDSSVTTGASVIIQGELVDSPAAGQTVEIHVETIEVIGTASAEEYPLQKKNHSFEFLRSIAHLRPRTQAMSACARIRSHMAGATHKFFQEEGFCYVQTPIITSLDCEGGGEMFEVVCETPFFDRRAYLTVSGQLHAEAFACGLGDVYTFGPTFRAENSHTSRHLAEFWMIEPEMAFAELKDVITIAEKFLKNLFASVLHHCSDDLALFAQWIDQQLISRLQVVVDKPFAHMTYTEAVDILLKSKKSFVYPVSWGVNLQSEHERFLCEEYVQGPLIVVDYPKDLKAFYMRDNADGTTVAAMDILMPYVGEIIGGSQREERVDVLQAKMQRLNMPIHQYQWYLDLRSFGTVAHGGFGAGFERLVQYATGLENIRDVAAFPRTPGSLAW